MTCPKGAKKFFGFLKFKKFGKCSSRNSGSHGSSKDCPKNSKKFSKTTLDPIIENAQTDKPLEPSKDEKSPRKSEDKQSMGNPEVQFSKTKSLLNDEVVESENIPEVATEESDFQSKISQNTSLRFMRNDVTGSPTKPQSFIKRFCSVDDISNSFTSYASLASEELNLAKTFMHLGEKEAFSIAHVLHVKNLKIKELTEKYDEACKKAEASTILESKINNMSLLLENANEVKKNLLEEIEILKKKLEDKGMNNGFVRKEPEVFKKKLYEL